MPRYELQDIHGQRLLLIEADDRINAELWALRQGAKLPAWFQVVEVPDIVKTIKQFNTTAKELGMAPMKAEVEPRYVDTIEEARLAESEQRYAAASKHLGIKAPETAGGPVVVRVPYQEPDPRFMPRGAANLQEHRYRPIRSQQPSKLVKKEGYEVQLKEPSAGSIATTPASKQESTIDVHATKQRLDAALARLRSKGTADKEDL